MGSDGLHVARGRESECDRRDIIPRKMQIPPSDSTRTYHSTWALLYFTRGFVKYGRVKYIWEGTLDSPRYFTVPHVQPQFFGIIYYVQFDSGL